MQAIRLSISGKSPPSAIPIPLSASPQVVAITAGLDRRKVKLGSGLLRCCRSRTSQHNSSGRLGQQRFGKMKGKALDSVGPTDRYPYYQKHDGVNRTGKRYHP